MKKCFMALLVLVLVSLLAVTASAADFSAEEEAAGQAEFMEATTDIPDSLRGRAREDAYAEALREMGWTVTEPAAVPVPQSLDIDPEILELAYSDLDSATPEMKGKIRMARRKVMYHPSIGGWSAHENCLMSGKIDYSAREFTINPRFEDLFPGWELPGSEFDAAVATAAQAKEPVEEAQGLEAMTLAGTAPSFANAESSLLEGILAVNDVPDKVVICFNGDVPLFRPHPTMTTAPFCRAPARERGICHFNTWANQFVNATSVNYGCKSPEGQDFGWQAGLKLNQKFYAQVGFVGFVDMRASTSGPEGRGWTIVERTYKMTGGM